MFTPLRLLLVFVIPGALFAEPATLWYKQPAAKWEEALPVGSGRHGAMIFGGTASERIQFNEDTLWTGKPHDYVRAGSGEVLPEVQKFLAEGKFEEAVKLGKTKLLSDPVRQKAYQPFGDLRFQFAGHEAATDYRRELNLDTAVATTRYRIGEVVFTREVFASYPDRAIVVRLSASQPGKVSFSLRMTSPHKNSAAHVLGHDALQLSGSVQADGLRFESRVRAVPSNGLVKTEGDILTVENANEVTLLLVAETSFVNYEDISADPAERCVKTLAHLDGRDFATLLAAHTADHQTLFRRVTLDLGRTPASELPTDERVKKVRAAKNIDADPALATLEFDYGRYLLIASSRPGSQPANLQGVWNELLDPPWESKWTTNINAQMNYWPAELTNLAECHEPLFDLIDDLVVSGRRTAQSLYKSRGWVVHHNTDLWRGTAPINNIDGLWPTGGAWLSYHLWEHFLFTRDKKFLKQRAYPAMKASSLFFVDSLVREPTRNWLVTSPSFSPEQGTLTVGPTMDIQLIRALWTATAEAAREFDPAFAAELETLLPQLPPHLIGRHGQLQEWLDDVDKVNNGHRHMSPLWALYPGADITAADPKVYDAAKVLLKGRGEGSTGWSYAWRIPLWARVGDGEFAYSQLSQLLAKRTLPNLFDLCGPFQIDGNFGATAGIAEMLLQSHQFTAADSEGERMVTIDILPALPKAWPTGSFAGLCARDGFEVDVTWENGAAKKITLRSKLGRPCVVRVGGKETRIETRGNESVVLDGALSRI
ncbi:glycoside hydrolase family 95 protein [Oleiharenicola lentus]|uniref:glycoside hydrolase family 95 protein n=1 Tax=Oleiharenicola lentus TaxID=2508720 RepID=UPI003F67CF23